jgi:hypothetical protein
MPIVVGPGIEIGGGITMGGGFVPSATLIFDLDAADYSALPVNGSVTAGAGTTGQRTLQVVNTTSRISWAADNGGVFRMTGSGTTSADYIIGGPNWTTGQSYTVFMAYRRSTAASGRLLNTSVEAQKDWLMGLYNGNPDTFFPNFAVNLPASGADLVWHFGWATWDTTTSLGQLYTATSSQPTGTSFAVTNASGGGPNTFRLFSRSSGAEAQTGDIGFVKAYDGVLTLSDVQGLYAQYKTRFGY